MKNAFAAQRMRPTMVEQRETREKRLAMRSMRRGIKEMDLILSAYAQSSLAQMDGATLDLYELLLDESDHDLYAWVSTQAEAPVKYANLISDIRIRFQPLKS